MNKVVSKCKIRIVAMTVLILLLISALPLGVSAASNTSIAWLVDYPVHSTLYGGYIYRVDRNLTYTASANNAALNIASGATVVIDIPAGYTLTVVGGSGEVQRGGGPGIYLPSNSTLIITGGGRLNATGGAGGVARAGGNGGSGYITSSWYYKGGNGGTGGSGGGGGGAGIGTYGGRGGYGGDGGYMSEAYCPDGGGNNAIAASGYAGGYGYNTASSGTLYVLGNVSVYAYGGSGTTSKSGGSQGGNASRKAGRYWTAGGGSGGGGGAGGYGGYAIGAGGPGGGAGGGGASGGRYSDSSGYTYRVGNGGKGGSGSSNGNAGVNGHGSFRTGSSAAGGGSGNYGTNGTVYKSTTAYVSSGANYSSSYYPSATTSRFTFDWQSGSGGVSATSVNYGCPIPNISVPTRSMYTFMGYYSGTGGSGNRYFDHRGVSTGAYYGTDNRTLYAYWVQSQFNITLNQQGGSGGTASVITTGTNGTLPSGITIPTKTHYGFRGYYQNAAGQGTQYYNSTGTPTANKITTNTSIYAYWVQNQYLTTFNMQGGTGGTSSAWTTGTDGTLPEITVPTRTGYVFGGYYSGTNGSGTQYYNSSGVAQSVKNTLANGRTLYAEWTPAIYTITYNLDGGINGAGNPDTRSYASNITVQPPTKQDYTFMGWQIDGGTQRYTDVLSFPAYNTQWAKNITLTATWLRSTITDAEIEVVGDGTVTNAAEIETALEEVFDYIVTDNEKGITAADMAGDKSVKLVLTVTASEDQNEETQIIEAAQGTALKFYDLKVRKEVTAAGGSTVVTNLTEIPIPITVKIAATGDLAGKPAYAVYRIHGEETEKLPVDPEANGEYYDSVGNEIVICTRRFSTYGIVGTTVALDNTGGTQEGFSGAQGLDVQGRIVEIEPDKVYKLDISWGDMKFEYSLQSEWDPDSHMYTEGALNYWRSESHNGINNRVTVKNHSNGDVRVHFAVASALEGVTMSMHIYNEKTADLAQYFVLEAAPVGSTTAELLPCNAYLFLDGVPTANWINQNKDAFAQVGVITVTAEAYPDA